MIPVTLRLALLASACFAFQPVFAVPDAAASAFVRDETKNAVQWTPWGDAAFRRAKAENKPIYLHIGFFTSELSRAMARQSFANAEAAKFLSDNFVCVVVDRDEQPALAALYRAYVHNVKQLDGWPINVWLTPELKPIEGATYLPPSEEWGKPGLMNVAKQVAAAWSADAAAQRQKAADAASALEAAEKLGAPAAIEPAALAKLVAENTDAWKAKFDATNGGFGDPPRRLEPELLRFLLRDTATRELALTTLRAMSDGAVRDPLDGGFFRQAMDPGWRQPYFQKTAADQARIALAFLDAARIDADPRWPAAARGALGYVLDELGDPARGLSAAQDASGEGMAFYLWSLDEVRAVLGRTEGDALAAALGITEAGNIPEDAYTGVTTAKKSIPYRAAPATALEGAGAKQLAKLRAARAQRSAPRLDSTASAGVHGLLLAAFSRAGEALKDTRYRTAAQQLARLIGDHFRGADGSLRRLPVESSAPAAPDDYALIIAGLRTYAAIASDVAAAGLAREFETRLNRDYFDPTSGRFFATTPETTPVLWARVHVPAPSAGELPAPETTYLRLISDATPRPAAADLLSRALAIEVRDSPEAPRGDLLWALYAQK